jgi:hypothetical protein
MLGSPRSIKYCSTSCCSLKLVYDTSWLAFWVQELAAPAKLSATVVRQ